MGRCGIASSGSTDMWLMGKVTTRGESGYPLVPHDGASYFPFLKMTQWSACVAASDTSRARQRVVLEREVLCRLGT